MVGTQIRTKTSILKNLYWKETAIDIAKAMLSSLKRTPPKRLSGNRKSEGLHISDDMFAKRTVASFNMNIQL
ncbi:hypothetical protein KY285_023861 [Solanum tuberosum]|nr:hypothetical protein KY289_024191 [Solanum tuberosum]KAH0676060.1 hypothetical protein KY285_023861 [Solanum tuberosum]